MRTYVPGVVVSHLPCEREIRDSVNLLALLKLEGRRPNFVSSVSFEDDPGY